MDAIHLAFDTSAHIVPSDWERDDVVERQSAELARDFTGGGNADAEELVARAVFAGRRAEEMLKKRRVFRGAGFAQPLSNAGECRPLVSHVCRERYSVPVPRGIIAS